jgi:hypothetical protein
MARPAVVALGADWRPRTTGEAIARRASRHLGAGDVILLHDADTYSAPGSWRRTAQALPAVLEPVGRAGLDTVGLERS